MKLNNLAPAEGATKNRKRIGRGPGSGHGKTATRGMKGHLARSGAKAYNAFEGGQMRLYRRVPKRGFHNRNRIQNEVVNLTALSTLDPKQTITVDTLLEAGLIQGPDPRVKILGMGEIEAAYTVQVHGVSESARQKIEAKGGQIEIIVYREVAEQKEDRRKAERKKS
ncbi:MAG TPA: 50S ribosomal protein L15 [bacterium]|nr:50S ribosomal protein L15 [bacterium]